MDEQLRARIQAVLDAQRAMDDPTFLRLSDEAICCVWCGRIDGIEGVEVEMGGHLASCPWVRLNNEANKLRHALAAPQPPAGDGR